jgi:hypothetical protein
LVRNRDHAEPFHRKTSGVPAQHAGVLGLVLT